MPLATKLDRMVTYLDGLLPIKVPDPLITWSCEIIRQTGTIISPMPPNKVVTYYEELPLIKLLDPSIMWFFMAV